jgi:hypothetical protein
MKMQWTTFEGRQYRREARKYPRVTLGAKGTFYLNGAAFEAMDRPAAFEMKYEGNYRIIGLKPTDPRRDNAFVIKHHGKGGNYKRVSAAAFCSQFRLKYPRTMLFEDPEIDNEGIMRLDLTKALEVSRGAR